MALSGRLEEIQARAAAGEKPTWPEILALLAIVEVALATHKPRQPSLCPLCAALDSFEENK